MMRLFVLGACLAACPVAPGHAGQVLGPLVAPSSAVQGGLPYSIYLPDAAADTGARLPVVYLLHGYGGGQREWIEGGRVAETLDALIGAGDVRPLIAVMPEAGKSWYVDSSRFGGPGDYATAILRDLIPEVDRRFPTDPDRRGVAGVSMGGFGALRFAFSQPDTFAAVVGLSPALFNPGGLSGSWMGDAPAGDLNEWYPRTFGETFDATIYAEQTPFAHVAALGQMDAPPTIMLIVGDDDYFALHDGTAEMYLALRAAGLKPELRVGDGGHDWAFWRGMAAEAFRFLDAALGPAR